jgi:hypothetical protein
MQQLFGSGLARPVLTKDRVLDDLTARLAARRSVATLHHAAYRRLARSIVDGSMRDRRPGSAWIGHVVQFDTAA